MITEMPKPTRINLNANQINALQLALDSKGRGRIINLLVGDTYDAEIEDLAILGEKLTKKFTGHFLPGSWQVRFIVLDSGIRNAYAYWMNSFEAICITNALARQIDSLCDDVASYLVNHSDERSGFAYIRDVELTTEEKLASLKGLLLQGAMAFFIGHEVGHLCAGHKPVMTAARAVATPDQECSEEPKYFVDEFIAQATSKNESLSIHSIRLNAHEVDADVQGLALSAAFWLELAGGADKSPAQAELVRAASSTQERLLLLASTGVAIAMSLMGFEQLKDDWNKQATHPLTAVRCVVGLAVLAHRLKAKPPEYLTLHLERECIEALSLVHSRLGSILLRMTESEGPQSEVAQKLRDVPSNEKLKFMFHATGVAKAVVESNDVVEYLAELSAEFNACEASRSKAIRVPEKMLANWSAVT